MADKKLESIKNLMAVESLSSEHKNLLLKLIMNGKLNLNSKDTITYADGVFIHTFNENRFNQKCVITFRVVISAETVKKQIVEDYNNSSIDSSFISYNKYSEDGRAIYQEYISTHDNNQVSSVDEDGKTIYRNFAEMPRVRDLKMEEQRLALFKRMLSDAITKAAATHLVGSNSTVPVDDYVELYDVTPRYRDYMPWIETYARWGGFWLQEINGGHRLYWTIPK